MAGLKPRPSTGGPVAILVPVRRNVSRGVFLAMHGKSRRLEAGARRASSNSWL